MNFSLKKGISGSTIKLVALVTMLIDHTGAVVVLQMIRSLGGTTSMTVEAYNAFMTDYSWLVTLYDVMRLVGRLAFPLFCFLLVEGFLHTRHLFAYGRNLAVFALISDPCFDLALSGTPLDFSAQNVFFTLFLGLLTLCVLRLIEQRFPSMAASLAWAPKLAAVACGCLAAQLLRTDYGAAGVLCISLMYLFRAHRTLAFSAGCIPLVFLSSSQYFSFLGLPLIYGYNGKRGLAMKYVFYIFYPAHLLLLSAVCRFLVN